MLNKDLEEAMNAHMSREFYAAYLYLGMAAFFESSNLPGMASWMVQQAKEEEMHGIKFFNYINDRGGRVRLLGIEQPPDTYNSPLDAFQHAFEQEKAVSRQINELFEHAIGAKDYASQAFLQWFVTEQVEEEKAASDIVERLKMVGDSASSLLLLDQEMGSRPAASAKA